MRLTDKLEKYIPKRVDWLKHDYLGGTAVCVYIGILILGAWKVIDVNQLYWCCLSFYGLWAILTAYNEHHQGKTGTGEKSVKDWLYGMRMPTMGMTIISILFYIFAW